MSEKKIKPIQIVFIVVACALSVAFFLFKDQFVPQANSNEVIEMTKAFIPTKAVVVDFERSPGERKTFMYMLISYKDQNGEQQSGKIKQSIEFSGTRVGDSISIYYNPANPSDCIDTDSYKAIVK